MLIKCYKSGNLKQPGNTEYPTNIRNLNSPLCNKTLKLQQVFFERVKNVDIFSRLTGRQVSLPAS